MNLWQSIIGGARRAWASVSNTVVSSDSAGMLALFGSMPSDSGEIVNEQTAMRVSTVYACLAKLAGTISQLPIHEYTLDANSDRQRVAPTPLWWLLNETPELNWTASAWKDWIVRCVMLRGDQLTQIIRSTSGAAIGLRPLNPSQVMWRRVSGRLHYYVTWTEGISGPVTTYGVDQDDMLHFAGFGFDGERSPSIISTAALNAIGNSLAAAKYTGKSLASGGLPQISLSYPNKLDKEQAQKLRDSFSATYGSNSSGKIPLVLSEGGNAKSLTLSAVDLEIMAQRNYEKEDICQAMGVPPVLIGHNEKTTSWGTGIEQITLGFVKFTCMPITSRWEEELNRKLYRRAGRFVEFDYRALLRGDTKSQSEAYRAALGGPGTGDGWMTINEVRKLQNLPTLSAEYDKPFRAERGGALRAPAKPAKADTTDTTTGATS